MAAGAIAGSASAVAALTVSPPVLIAGTVTSSSSAAASLTVSPLHQITGTIAATAGGSATLLVTPPLLAGVASSSATVAASLTVTHSFVLSTSAGLSTATATLTVTSPLGLIGAIHGTSGLTGVLSHDIGIFEVTSPTTSASTVTTLSRLTSTSTITITFVIRAHTPAFSGGTHVFKITIGDDSGPWNSATVSMNANQSAWLTGTVTFTSGWGTTEMTSGGLQIGIKYMRTTGAASATPGIDVDFLGSSVTNVETQTLTTPISPTGGAPWPLTQRERPVVDLQQKKAKLWD